MMPPSPQPAPRRIPPRAGATAALVALIGAGAASLLNEHVPEDEGMVYRGYRDPVGIPTKCAGDTQDVVVGRRYSRDECADSLAKQLLRHARPVLACVPQLEGHPFATYAAVSWAYNGGPRRFCNSVAAARFRVGDWRGGCLALGPAYVAIVTVNGRPTRREVRGLVTAKGRVLPGLVRRRAKESSICMREVTG